MSLKGKLALVVLVSILPQCGKSPLLHHDSPKAVQKKPVNQPQQPQAEPTDKPDPSASSNPSDNPPGQPVPRPTCNNKLQKAGLCADLTWVGENEFTLKFWNLAQAGPSGPFSDPPQSLFIKLWMPAMGHGSSKVTLTRSSQGIFEATDVYFTMPGAWEIHIQLKNGAQLAEETIVPVTI